jgi:agmatine deiminase
LAWTNDQTDPQWEISADAYNILSKETDAKGRRLEIHKLHQPQPMFITKEESEGFEAGHGTISRKTGDRLPASYVNFYIANGGVVMPSFNDPMDIQAVNTLQSLFPDRKVVAVSAREILLGGGAVHCIVQQIPLPRK